MVWVESVFCSLERIVKEVFIDCVRVSFEDLRRYTTLTLTNITSEQHVLGVFVIVHAVRSKVLLQHILLEEQVHLGDSHCPLFIQSAKVFLYHFKEPLPRFLTSSLLYFVEVNHTVREVDNLKIGVR